MATSAHLDIRAAVAALFLAAPALATRVTENRDLSLPEGVQVQIDVYRLRTRPERPYMGTDSPVDWTTDLRIVVKGRSEAVVDDVMCSCYARVMADQDLGGLASGLEPGDMLWGQEELETNVVRATWDIVVQHQTRNNVITS